MTRRRIIGGAVAAAALLIAIQFIPVDRSNPPPVSSVTAPPKVLEILHRACFDCHSHRTRWPWYSRVAPVSWLVAHHVAEARGDLDFDEWPLLDFEGQDLALRDIETELVKGKMPPGYYKLFHPPARLTAAEVDVLLAWARER